METTALIVSLSFALGVLSGFYARRERPLKYRRDAILSAGRVAIADHPTEGRIALLDVEVDRRTS